MYALCILAVPAPCVEAGDSFQEPGAEGADRRSMPVEENKKMALIYKKVTSRDLDLLAETATEGFAI